MSYARIRATAEAGRYLDQREADERAKAYQRASAAANRMMDCGLTSQQWIDQYLGRNSLGNGPESNTETTDDDDNGREATGTEARSGGAGEGVGDPPQECEEEKTIADGGPEGARPAVAARLEGPGNEANWIDEAYPEGSEGADFIEPDRTPF